MKYTITSSLFIEDEKYWLLSDEVNSFSKEQVQSIVKDIENVLQGKYEESCFGYEVSSVTIRKETCKIEYNGELIDEVPTIEIYQLMRDWRDHIFKENL